MMESATTVSERDKLIIEHYFRVKIIAKKRLRRLPHEADLEDIISYGTFGLIAAAQNFKPELGYKFTTYAGYRINGEITDALGKKENWHFIEADEDECEAVEASEKCAPEKTVACDYICDSVRKAIKELPALEGAIVTLNDLEGISQLEIARRFGISEAWVCIMRKKALKILREKLSNLRDAI
jgi:RNA polymerase sigma factor (sigma-70 family)